jgi:hypothetical protein
VVLLQLVACSSKHEGRAPVLVTGDGLTGVIFPPERKLYFLSPTAQTWMPSEKEVRLAESQLSSFLIDSADRQPEALVIAKHLSSYKRQYAGIVNSGEKKIFFNVFCQAFETEWTKDPVIVEDGGHCFFQVEFSLKSKSFNNLQINGRA